MSAQQGSVGEKAPATESDSLLIADCALLDPHSPTGIREGQHVSIRGDKIRAVSSRAARQATHTIRARGQLALPGLINAHSHSPESLVKATAEKLSLEPWLLDLFRGLPTAFSDRQLYLAAALNALTMIRTGATAVLDHVWMSPQVTLSGLDAVMAAYRDLGFRAAVAPMVDDVNPFWRFVRQAGLSVDAELASALGAEECPTIASSVQLLEAFIRRWHEQEGGRLRALAGPGNVFSCTPEFWVALKELAVRYRTGLHSHAVETQMQAALSRDLFGKSAVQMLDEIGVLGPEVSLAHCVWLDAGDLQRLAASGATLVHNPASNLKLGSGLAPVPDARKAGVNVALGADGAASNDSQSMFEAMKLAAVIHNPGEHSQRWPGASDVLQMATQGGARVLGLDGCLGTVEPGMLADIILIDLENPTFVPLNNPVYHLVYCESGASVHTVIIDGRVVMEDGHITTVDERSLLQEIRESWGGAPLPLSGRIAQLLPQLEALDRLRHSVLGLAVPPKA